MTRTTTVVEEGIDISPNLDGLKPQKTDGTGEMIDIDETGLISDNEVTDMPDGGAMIQLKEEAVSMAAREHFRNLAEDMSESELNSLSIDIMQLIDEDKESRKKRDAIYAEGIRRTGLGDDAPGGAQFEGASKVVHPLITEVCVDFQARVMKELFPASGPVKQHIPGTPTKEKLEKSRRKAKYMNFQFLKQIKEFRSELEQTLTQVPLGGAAYLKISHDDRFKRPTVEFIPIDDIYYPFAASSFNTAERKTHHKRITELKLRRCVDNGMYRDVELSIPALPEDSKSQTASDKIEGKDATSQNTDGLRSIFETSCYLDIEEVGCYDPYLVTIDDSTNLVLAVYRNWKPTDDKKEELQHVVEFPFVPWRGAAPIGITHMIGSLSGALTGALRALLDSAHINTVPTALKLKGGLKGGQNLRASATEISEIEGAGTTDDIRKLIMPMPFNQPSPVLFQLLGFLTEQGRGVIQTTFEGLADQKTDMPVGTTLALIEQGMTVFSAIHARLHHSMMQVMEIVHRINGDYMEAEDVKDELGEIIARPKDFQGPMDVIPVSDPNIFSDVQRQAQIALIAGRAGLPQNMQAGMYNLHRIEKMILEYAKIPAPEELLNPIKEPMKDNAVNENVKATMGTALIAFAEQDHEAHIATHLAFMLHPIFGSSPLIAPTYIPNMVMHLRDHIAFWYVATVVEVASDAAGVDISKLMDPDDDVSKEFDKAMQKASEVVLQAAGGNQTLMQLPPVIQKAMEYVKQHQQPPPMDPSLVAMKEVERKAAADQVNAQAEQKKLGQKDQELQLKGQAVQASTMKTQMDAQKSQMEGQSASAAQQLDAYNTQQELALKAKDAEADATIKAAGVDAQNRALDLKEAETNQKAQIEAQRIINDQSELEAERQAADAAMVTDVEMEKYIQDNENLRTDKELSTKLEINKEDNNTAMRIAAAEISSGERAKVSTGSGTNPGS